MYPDPLFLGIDLYTVMIFIGILAALVVFRIFCDRKKAPAKVFNFFLIILAVSIAVGFFSASLVQSIYNYVESGVWEWRGMTFLGGLVGGVLCFFLFYFSIGHFVFRQKDHVLHFSLFVRCAVPCIVLAHAFGRIGCLFAGCCYGIPSESLGLPMLINGVYEKRIATQLIESIFLFLLFGVLTFLLFKKDFEFIAQTYMIAYGVFRFAIEYLRDDPRGSTGLSFITPSQLTSVFLILFGVGLVFFHIYLYPKLIKKLQPQKSTTETEPEQEHEIQE